MEQIYDINNVTKDMTIGEIIKKFPQIVPILQENGIHCVGCHISPLETLEQGFKGHGMAEEEIKNLLDKINKFLLNQTNLAQDVYFTDNAINKFLEIKRKEDKNNYFLRFQVLPGGCAGFKYDFTFDTNKNTNDLIMEKQDLKILIDKESVNFLKGAKVDYVEALNETGFKITNPNANSTCGCGSSFG